MALFENAVAAKARAMYGQMLSPAQYHELVHKQSVREIASYLKNKTSYGQTLAELQESTAHRGLLENLLQRDVFYQYVRLAKYVPNQSGIYSFLILQIEVELILACMRESLSPSGQNPLALMPGIVQPYACFDIFALAQAKTLSALLLVLEKTPFAAVLERCRQKNPAELGSAFPYAEYEIALRRHYLQTMLDRADACARGKAREQLRDLILMRADLMNISALFRMKAFFHLDCGQLQERLLPFYGRLSPRQVAALAQAQDVQALELLLRQGPYARGFRDYLREEQMIETVTERILYHHARHLMRFSTDPQVVYVAFMLLRTIELENITRMIEGVRYQLSPERIEQLLCR